MTLMSDLDKPAQSRRPEAVKGSPTPAGEITPVNVETVAATGVRYSICTLVSDWSQYREMLASFAAKGFATTDCEYLYADNTNENRFDGFSGINRFLTRARGEYVIICHQDVRLHDDGREQLERVIAELNAFDSDWGVLGNSGGIAPGRQAIRITDPHGENQRRDSLPARVDSLDENFLLVRRDANLAVSADIRGFHLYGVDLCIFADLIGHSAYVTDFHLHHLSGGVKGDSFPAVRRALLEKYARAFRPRWVKAPSTIIRIGGAAFARATMNLHRVGRAYDLSAGLVSRLWRRQTPTASGAGKNAQ